MKIGPIRSFRMFGLDGYFHIDRPLSLIITKTSRSLDFFENLRPPSVYLTPRLFGTRESARICRIHNFSEEEPKEEVPNREQTVAMSVLRKRETTRTSLPIHENISGFVHQAPKKIFRIKSPFISYYSYLIKVNRIFIITSTWSFEKNKITGAIRPPLSVI